MPDDVPDAVRKVLEETGADYNRCLAGRVRAEPERELEVMLIARIKHAIARQEFEPYRTTDGQMRDVNIFDVKARINANGVQLGLTYFWRWQKRSVLASFPFGPAA